MNAYVPAINYFPTRKHNHIYSCPTNLFSKELNSQTLDALISSSFFHEKNDGLET